MKAAIKAVEVQSVSKAERVMRVVNLGPRPYLSNEEEKQLSSYLKQCSKIGCGKTHRDVVSLVQNTVSDKGVLQIS